MRALVQQLLAAAAVLLVPALWLDRVFGRAFWEVGLSGMSVLLILVAAYVIAAAYLVWRARKRTPRLPEVLLAFLATTGLVVVGVLAMGVSASTVLIALAATGSLVLLLGLSLVPGWHAAKIVILLLTVLSAGAIHAAYALDVLPRAGGAEAATLTIRSNLYTLQARRYSQPIPTPLQTGGAMALLWDDHLLATGDGQLYRFAEAPDGTSLETQALRLRIPTNPDEFRRDVADLGLRQDFFRVADIHTIVDDQRIRLFATHHYWYSDRECYTFRLSAVEVTRAQLENDAADLPWATLFESTPCLPIRLPDGTPFFKGLETGGRIADLGRDSLFFTLGDQEYDGVNAPGALAQDTTASYGKTYTVDLNTGRVERFSIGHRNPQGLFVADDGTVWATEHGPRGGDELNRLERGNNYGWPIVTYGVNYESVEWPSNPHQGTHENFTPPVWAWVPSTAPSALLSVRGPKFPAWKGDLIAGSLKGRTLWRIRMVDGHVVLTEAMGVDVQVRDLIEGHDGKLIIWDEQYPGPQLVFIEPSGADASGEALFASCAGCHTADDGATNGIGPNLGGIVGERVASREGFTYSAALANVGGSWTPERLDRFLANPQEFAPGTNMSMPGIPDAEQRRRLIDYLSSLR